MNDIFNRQIGSDAATKKVGTRHRERAISYEEYLQRQKEIEKSNQVYILDPKDVEEKGEMRVRQWAAELMRRNEYKFTPKWQDRQIVTSGEVEPEAIDVRAIYPFPDLHWIIWKNKMFWSFMLLSQHRMLFNIDFAKI
jgi:hypothetical protein